MITITEFNGTNHAQWGAKMALHLEQQQVYGVSKRYHDKPEEPGAHPTTTEKAAFKAWTNHHGVAKSTIRQGMESGAHAECMFVENAKTLLDKLASACTSQLKFNIFEIRDYLWAIKLQGCKNVDNYTLQMDPKFNNCYLYVGQSTTDTDADMDSAKTIAMMIKQERILYLLCGIPRNDEWKVFLQLTMDRNAMMTTTRNEIVTKLAVNEAAIK